MWIDYLPFATLAHNTYNSPNMSNYSPYELVFGRETKAITRLGNQSRYKDSNNIQRILWEVRTKIKIFTESSLRLK